MGKEKELEVLRSPRANLRQLIMKDMPEGFLLSSGGSDAFEALATAELVPADAENKLHHKKLYLVLDLDETLVYSKRMEDPMATPAGHKIFVRGQPFDMVLRPGLQHFLRMAVSNYIVFLYTMGDEDYTRAVLRIIDPESNFFRGGICCWRQSESRHHKSLTRVVCDRRMALIVDDSIDVWSEDLSNLCLTRRFVGDKLDDGLQLLCGQLFGLHREFFANAPSEGWSYEAAASGTLRAAPRVQSVLHTQRGQLLAGCTIALTGVVTDQKEDTLEQQPLCVLIKHYGGELTLSVDAATHLVARRKEGWQKSPKINRALQRQQARPRHRRPCPVSPRAHGRPAIAQFWLRTQRTEWKGVDGSRSCSNSALVAEGNHGVCAVHRWTKGAQTPSRFEWTAMCVWCVVGKCSASLSVSVATNSCMRAYGVCLGGRGHVAASALLSHKPYSPLPEKCDARCRMPLVAPPAQAGATGFYVVWDHWLLDTLATWQKQNEESYAVRLDDERGDSPPPTSLFSQQLEGVAKAITADVENLETVSDLVPPRKRLREEGVAFEQVVTH